MTPFISLALTTQLFDDLIFLMRDDCDNALDMQLSLEDALKDLGWPVRFQSINIDMLPPSDVRTLYPTPTLLWRGQDLFGMPRPTRPYGTET